ncbi:fumarylacetoacetate hydrolase family protein [Sphingobium nicotianae]|uniref:Fumarylacetoacetate hydrolase family protein n=1 Tax=Sphingobium nicotianae TaxID=2782607 RepID=A0A9X1IRM3_9SPHN|nr:fumarylacetoacetate hydrolase family protein [Sphingobium nicotianae]MBT2187335.1 fumarylacetoacetate hydrolase family protein [Sphingobium nicotianae]
MKLVSFMAHGRAGWGMVEGDAVRDMSAALPGTPSLRTLLEQDGIPAAGKVAASAPLLAMETITLLPVIPDPAKIFCIGLNYVEHREETNNPTMTEPTIFVRFANSLTAHGMPIRHPAETDMLDYEAELAVIIGKGGRRISRAAAYDHVAGYACANDVSVRDWQRHTTQYTPGKNWPTSGPLGPWLVTRDEVGELAPLRISCRLNGETVQDAHLGDLIFDVPRLIEYISTFTELAPGDVIFTGTPGGVGAKRVPPLFMKPGDRVEVEIEKVGLLVNPVVQD